MEDREDYYLKGIAVEDREDYYLKGIAVEVQEYIEQGKKKESLRKWQYLMI